MNREEAKTYIRNNPAFFLQAAKTRGYICPLCGNGKGADGDGIVIDPRGDGKHLKCFKCGFYGDMIELIAKMRHIADGGSAEAFEAARAAYGIVIDDFGAPAPVPAKKSQDKPDPAQVDYTDRYTEWHKTLLQTKQALDYLHGRGVTDEAIEHFNLGYCGEWAHSTHPNIKSRRVIIPRSAYSYTTRRIDGGAEYRYIKEGKQTLFNDAAFTDDDAAGMPIVVVEGEFDCIAIWQTGWRGVIALGTTENAPAFIDQAKAENPNAAYIVAMDADESGSRAQDRIVRGLTEAGIICVGADTATLYGGKKDPAEAAQADAEGFITRLVEYVREAYERKAARDKAAEIEAYNRSGAGMVDSFLKAVQTETFKPISSGIKSLDSAIGGGFVRQSVVLLGAAPGMGKTALISQICENIAQTGAGDVLYINLEMSREVLLARSIARIANRGRGRSLSVSEILRGYEWDAGTRDAIQAAAEEYKSKIAGHLIYNPGEATTDIDAILRKAEEERRRIGHAPMLCVDYLQLLTGRPDEDEIQVIKRSMLELKQYANSNRTIVFVIVANNRESTKTGRSDLNSGRDSSSIEYGADLHMGLEYEAISKTAVYRDGEWTAGSAKSLDYIAAIKKKYYQILKGKADISSDFWSMEEKALKRDYEKYCTRYIVRVNKNRYADSGASATLVFDGAAARFLELDTIHTEPPARRGWQEEIDIDDLPL